MRRWRGVTDYGTFYTVAKSEAEAERNIRAKAVDSRYMFPNGRGGRIERAKAIRECGIYELKELGGR